MGLEIVDILSKCTCRPVVIGQCHQMGAVEGAIHVCN